MSAKPDRREAVHKFLHTSLQEFYRRQDKRTNAMRDAKFNLREDGRVNAMLTANAKDATMPQTRWALTPWYNAGKFCPERKGWYLMRHWRDRDRELPPMWAWWGGYYWYMRTPMLRKLACLPNYRWAGFESVTVDNT